MEKMTLGRVWREMRRGKFPSVKDVWAYATGHYRKTLFYSPFDRLIRSHIRDQIQHRLFTMDRQCREQGYCKLCGCDVPAMQFSSKSCDKPCYPPLMGKKKWRDYVSKMYDSSKKHDLSKFYIT